MEVPNMAVIIWTMNRMPTAVAVLLLDPGGRSISVGVGGVVLRVLMACPFGVKESPRF